MSLVSDIKKQLDSGISSVTGKALTAVQKTSLLKQYQSAAGKAYVAPSATPAPIVTPVSAMQKAATIDITQPSTNNYGSPQVSWGGSSTVTTPIMSPTQAEKVLGDLSSVKQTGGPGSQSGYYYYKGPDGRYYMETNGMMTVWDDQGQGYGQMNTIDGSSLSKGNFVSLADSAWKNNIATNPSGTITQIKRMLDAGTNLYGKPMSEAEKSQYLNIYKQTSGIDYSAGDDPYWVWMASKDPKYKSKVASMTGAQGATQQGNTQQGGMPDISQIKINTGNPTADAYANMVLDQIWGMYSGTLSQIDFTLPENLVAQIEADIDKQFGGKISEWKSQAEASYNTSKGSLTEQLAIERQKLGNTQRNTAEDVNRQTGEINTDVTRNLQVLGRNLDEAKKDSDLAYQAANRTFSGRRDQATRKLEDASAFDAESLRMQQSRDLGTLSREQQRTLDGLALAERSLKDQETTGNFSLEEQNRQALQQIEDYRQSLINSEKTNVTNYPWTVLPGLMDLPSYMTQGESTTAPPVQSTPAPAAPTPTVATTPKVEAPSVSTVSKVYDPTKYAVPTRQSATQTWKAGDVLHGRTLTAGQAASINNQNKTLGIKKPATSNLAIKTSY